MAAFKYSMFLSVLGGCLAAAYVADTARGGEHAAIEHGQAATHDHAAQSGADPATTSGNPEGLPWDDKHSRELEASLHELHEVWNTGNIAALKQYIIGDDLLPTFELDPRTHQAIKLDSKAALDGFVSKVVTTQDGRNLVTELEMPKVHCRASATWGVCTEECTVKYKAQSGALLGTDRLWSTQVAINTQKGWRWIQWHMSDATPPQSTNIH